MATHEDLIPGVHGALPSPLIVSHPLPLSLGPNFGPVQSLSIQGSWPPPITTSTVPLPLTAPAPIASVAPLTHSVSAVGPSQIFATSASPTLASMSPVASPISTPGILASFGPLTSPKTPVPPVPAPGFGANPVKHDMFASSISRTPFTLGYQQPGLSDLQSDFDGSRSSRRPGPHSRRIRRVPQRVRSVHSVLWPDAWNLIPNPSIRQNDVRISEAHNLGAPKSTEKVLIWHCQHPHGLFSMFSLALGHAETCEKQGLALVVDWTSTELLYRGPPGEPNVWNAFFLQPAEMKMTCEAISHALRCGQYIETSKHNIVYGHYRGVIQDYGGIPAEQAARGRALCRRNVALQPRFRKKLEQLKSSILKPDTRRLAVHIRRSDKVIEAAANFELSDQSLLKRIVSQCAAWKMTSVFLCSDDASLKKRLTKSLEQSGLFVSTYDATLPAQASQAVHFDKSLDSYKKAEDVVVEAFLMATGCHGLLSTYSNVSAAVVYLSPDSFPYTTFWDPVVQEDVSPCASEL